MELEEVEKAIKERKTKPNYPCKVIDYPLHSGMEVQKSKEHETARKH